MKSTITVLIVCMMGALSACHGQVSKTETKKDSSKQMNLLDEQTKMFGQIFDLAGAGEDNPFGGAKNYLELIENADLLEEQKNTIREQYKVYDLSLDPTKKDSLELMVSKMLENAMEKSQNEPNH